LSRFKNDFPRLQDLRNIYATETMQRLIAAVYADVLNFSQQAVEYYQMTTLGMSYVLYYFAAWRGND
jgi:hypothetical protein